MLKNSRTLKHFTNMKIPYVLALIIVWLCTSMGSHVSMAAEIQTLDTIRVSLFIDQRGTVPSVSLSHSSPMQLAVGTLDASKTWLTGYSSFRASINTYKVKLLETTDYQAALTLRSQYQSSVDELTIMSNRIKGQHVYQVYAGNYGTLQEAEQVKSKLQADAHIAPFIQDSTLSITGPRYVSVGTYETAEEAASKQNVLQQHGVGSFLAYYENQDGVLQYAVWVGEVLSDTAMTNLKSQIANALPETVFTSVDTSKPYLLQRTEVLTGGTTLPHFSIGTGNQKLVIKAEQPGIKVNERYGRSYRGQLELREFNGKLALINVVPFEEYLYSVVSTEMGGGFPLEALKAQAVAARTYALTLGMKYKIAHISDTTYDQAYKGFGAETADAVQAVKETKDEILVNQDGLIVPFYSSNAGGLSAVTEEVWDTPLSYIHSVSSPDEIAQSNRLNWHRVVMSDGSVGYIRSDFTKDTGSRNAAGLPIHEVTGEAVNVREAPYVDNAQNPAIQQVNTGEQLIVFDTVKESSPYAWIRGPFSSEEVKAMVQSRVSTPIQGTVTDLEVTKRGPSDRVMEIKVNGQMINVSSPDGYRTVFNSLPSTRFEIEETAEFTILGADGTVSYSAEHFDLYTIEGSSINAASLEEDSIFIMDADRKVRLASLTPQYRFVGKGYGHGLGMSQWGAMGLAQTQGYDYQQILKYYYKDVSIVKG